MFEYGVELSEARSPEDMTFVANAYYAGQSKKQKEIWQKIELYFNNNPHASKDDLRKIIYDDNN